MEFWEQGGGPPRIIGMVHVAALPGAPHFGGDFAAVKSRAVADALTLQSGGVDAIMVENFFDVPFPPTASAAVTIAHMTSVATAIREAVCDLPIGINILRNDALGALAVAQACDAQFIRVNILCGARVTDQGIIQGNAYSLMRERQRCGAAGIRIAADVDVKHSGPLAPRPLNDEAAELLQRSGADALIVSGTATGSATDVSQVAQLRESFPEAYLMVGSGVRPDNVRAYAGICDAVVVGSSLKENGELANPVDSERVRELVACNRSARFSS